MSRKQARQQVGNPISYIFSNESNIKSNQLVEEFQTFKDIMDDTGMSAKEVADILGNDLSPEISSYVKTSKDGKLSTEGFKTSIGNLSIGAKAGQVALKGLAIAGNMLLMWGISEAISALYKFSQVSKDVANSAQEIGSSFKETKKDINSYKEKVEELRGVINNSSSSVSEVTQARKD